MYKQSFPNLVISTESGLNTWFNNDKGMHEKKQVNFNHSHLVAYENTDDNIVIYEKNIRKLKIYTNKAVSVSEFDVQHDLTDIIFYKNRFIFGSDKSSKLHCFDTYYRKYKMAIASSSNGQIVKLCMSFNEKFLYACHENGLVSVLYDSTNFHSLDWLDKSVTAINTSPFEKDNLLTGFANGIVSLYDMESKRKLINWNIHEKRTNCLTFSYSNEKLLMSGGDDCQAILLVTDQKRAQKIFQTEGAVTACAMSDNLYMAFGDSCGYVYVYDMRNLLRPIATSNTGGRVEYLGFKLNLQKSYSSSDMFNQLDMTDLSLLQDAQLTTNCINDNSGNSVFSCAEDSCVESVENRTRSEDSFDASVCDSNEAIRPTPPRKHVQFVPDHQSTPLIELSVAKDLSLPLQSPIVTKSIVDHANQGDTRVLLTTINDLKIQIQSLESKLDSREDELKCFIFDRLTELENNMDAKRSADQQRINELINENKYLRQELKKRDYGI